VAHVEFSLSELGEPTEAPRRIPVHGRAGQGLDGSLDRWAFVVSGATEPCLLVEVTGVVVAASPGCADLLSINSTDAVGRRLVNDVLRLLDFRTVSRELPEWEVDKIPPLLACRSGVLARGLLRVAAGDVTETVDAISTPLRDGAAVVGSLTFFAPVGG
jgi:hypothetical protein